MGKFKDLTGQRFGRLVAIHRDYSQKKAGTWWVCQCDCWKTKSVRAGLLTKGITKSCGCLKAETMRKMRTGSTEREDLTGKKFGRLTALHIDEKKTATNHKGKVFWVCQCECGNVSSIASTALKNGDTQSCGCLRKERVAQSFAKHNEEFIGKRFGSLVVVEKDASKNSRHAYWICRCDCGNMISVQRYYLEHGITRHCGCQRSLSKPKKPKGERRNPGPHEDLTGRVFGRLHVDNLFGKKSGEYYWNCTCECGSHVQVRGISLRRGITRSCGCLARELTKLSLRVDLTNQRFGKLVAICDSGKRCGSNLIWTCKCDCGRTAEVTSHNLRTGNTTSCGHCTNVPHGEQAVMDLLDEHGMSYLHDTTELGCRFPKTNRPARFDFFVDGKYVIEWDGIQHFGEGHGNWQKQEPLAVRQERDNYKTKWCHSHNIPIIRIPYTRYNKLQFEDLLIETSPFLLRSDGGESS